MRCGAAAAIAKDAKPVRVVDHNGGAKFLRQSADARKVCDVSVNREHAVNHHERSRARRHRSKARLESRHVVVLESLHLAKAHASC